MAGLQAQFAASGGGQRERSLPADALSQASLPCSLKNQHSLPIALSNVSLQTLLVWLGMVGL